MRQIDTAVDAVDLDIENETERHAATKADGKREYVILTGWTEGGRVIARNEKEALEAYFTQGDVPEGRVVAIASRMWKPREVKIETKQSFKMK